MQTRSNVRPTRNRNPVDRIHVGDWYSLSQVARRDGENDDGNVRRSKAVKRKKRRTKPEPPPEDDLCGDFSLTCSPGELLDKPVLSPYNSDADSDSESVAALQSESESDPDSDADCDPDSEDEPVQEGSELLPFRAVLDTTLAHMVQDDLEVFYAAVDGGEEFDAPMSASECAKAAEINGGNSMDKKGTAAYRACLVYNRQILKFYTSPAQQRRTAALRQAGSLHANDARIKIPLILKDVQVGREMEDLPMDDFFFLIGAYMNNSRRVRVNMQGNTKRNHMNDILRVYRKFLQDTEGRKWEADFKWKTRMAETWKIMQADTLKRAEAGIEQAKKSADPFSRR